MTDGATIIALQEAIKVCERRVARHAVEAFGGQLARGPAEAQHNAAHLGTPAFRDLLAATAAFALLNGRLQRALTEICR